MLYNVNDVEESLNNKINIEVTSLVVVSSSGLAGCESLSEVCDDRDKIQEDCEREGLK